MKDKIILSKTEFKKILLDVMNLGMQLRQDQLRGYDGRSGNEVLEEYLLKN